MVERIPGTVLTLIFSVYRKIFPQVDLELHFWQTRAEGIPNSELRSQALASIETKRFHCQGGAVYALLAGEEWKEAIRFIVAYQTISDYLDNLCDRSTSMDPNDFRLLHQAMVDALTPENKPKNYYALRGEQEDAAYLIDLVKTCQRVVDQLNFSPTVYECMMKLEGLYEDLQVHKHVTEMERIPRLTKWYEKNRGDWASLKWYEFAAAAGSTLGVFCTVSYALKGKLTDQLAQKIYDGYFPFMQGLHILLDYYIDQQEDRYEGDLNFCSYYPNGEKMKKRFIYFIKEADKHVQQLPDSKFHEMIHHGLVGLYLGDPKVKQLSSGAEMKKELLEISGRKAKFFYWNTIIYYRFKNTKNKPL